MTVLAAIAFQEKSYLLSSGNTLVKVKSYVHFIKPGMSHKHAAACGSWPTVEYYLFGTSHEYPSCD